MERTLASELVARAGERVRIAGWLHHQRQLARVTFVLVRDRSGIAQVVLVDPDGTCRRGASRAGDGDRGGGDGRVPATRRPRASSSSIRRSTVIAGPGGGSAVRAAPTGAERPAPDAARPRRGVAAPPGATGDRGDRGGVGRGLPRDARCAGLHGGLHAEGRRRGDRERRQRVPDRLVRPARLPGAEPAVLQADHGRGLRACLRGRPRVPRRAARHRAAPRAVPVAGRRDRLHHRPPRRDGRPAVRPRRHGRGHHRARRPALDVLALALPDIPDEIPVVSFRRGAGDDRARHRAPDGRRARPVAGRRTLARRLGAHRARVRASSSSPATRW